MKIVPLFLLPVIGTISCHHEQTQLTKEEVIAVIRKFDQGWKTKNLKTVDTVLAPSYIYFTQSGGTFNRSSLVATAGSPEYTLDTVDRMEFHVQVFGNTAVVSTRWQGKGTYKGVYFNEDQRCSLTVVKNNGEVMILSEHCTPIRPNRIFH